MHVLKTLTRQSLLAALLGGAALLQVAQAGTITGVTVAALDSSNNPLGTAATVFSGSDDLSDGFSLSSVAFNIGSVNYSDVEKWQVSLTGTFDKPVQVTSAEVDGKYALQVQVVGVTGGVTVKFPFSDDGVADINSTPATFSFAANDLVAQTGTASPLSELKFSMTASEVTPVPIPATAVLFGSGLVGLLGFGQAARRRKDDSVAA